jgi:hypothetical protein
MEVNMKTICRFTPRLAAFAAVAVLGLSTVEHAQAEKTITQKDVPPDAVRKALDQKMADEKEKGEAEKESGEKDEK